MLKAIEVSVPPTIWPFIKYSNASTKEEFCKIPRKKYLKVGGAPDPELTSRLQKPCMKSHHPNIHICKKKPETDFARKVHREIKGLLKRLKEKKLGGEREKRQRIRNCVSRWNCTDFQRKITIKSEGKIQKENYQKSRGKILKDRKDPRKITNIESHYMSKWIISHWL